MDPLEPQTGPRPHYSWAVQPGPQTQAIPSTWNGGSGLYGASQHRVGPRPSLFLQRHTPHLA